MANDINIDMDMFSKLPNNLICNIVSCLPFKDAARTSTLSQRWSRIWLATKKIEFLESVFIRDDADAAEKELHRVEFFDFVRRWIGNHSSTSITTFRLVVSRPEDFLGDVENCITFAISRNVSELVLDFHDPAWGEHDGENHDAVFELPMRVYGHSGLESLELSSCSIIPAQFNRFVAVKQLFLGWIQLKRHSIRELLVRCPLLESLSLKKCWEIEYLDITVPNLKLERLVIDKCDFTQNYYEIMAPKLKFLKYSGEEGMFLISRQDSLSEVELDFGLQQDFDGATGELLYELLRQLQTVKVLTVCTFLLQMIPHAEEPLGMGAPLEVNHLILNASMHPHEYHGINFMLKSCPLLRTLTINISPQRILPDYTPAFDLNPEHCWTKFFTIYRCITKSLRVVNVKGFRGTNMEVRFLNYVLYFGNVMQELNLYLPDEDDGGVNREAYLQRAQLVQQFRRVSANLRISIY